LNAAGRLGQAQLGVELLTTQIPERASSLAEYLHELNKSRDSLERSIYLGAGKQIREQFNADADPAFVLASRGWHPGVIGIVAGRLAEKYHRPVVLIALDELGLKPGIGSARSVPGFDLHAAFMACCEHLVAHGGHAAAAGLKIEEQRIEDFRIDFCRHAAEALSSAERMAELWIDGEVILSSLTPTVVAQIERLAPFGHGNSRPILCASNVLLIDAPKRVGNSGQHLQMRFEQHGVRMRAVAFGGGEWQDELAAVDGPLNVAFRPTINEFGGRRTVEMHIADWQASVGVGTGQAREKHD
jgi:single-stranded-DNA-specific exonuclease